MNQPGTCMKRSMAVVLAVSMLAPGLAFAQAGAKPAPTAEKVQLLFVQNSTGVAIDKTKNTLTLKGVSPSTLFFADRPVRLAGHYHTTQEFLAL